MSGELRANIAHRLRVQAAARKSWSFKPKSTKKKILRSDNSVNYGKIVDSYLGCKDLMIHILALNRVPPWDRDDILQEVVTLALDRGDIREHENWMIRTLRFQIIIYFRMNKKFRTRFTHLEPIQIDGIKESQLRLAIETSIGWWHARLDIRKAMKCLTPRMQWLVMMKARGYRDNEIGTTTGYAPKSIRKLYSRGIQHLYEELTSSARPGSPR